MPAHISHPPQHVRSLGDLCVKLRCAKGWTQERLAEEIQFRYDDATSMLSTIKRFEIDASIRMDRLFKIFATLHDIPKHKEEDYFIRLFEDLLAAKEVAQ